MKLLNDIIRSVTEEEEPLARTLRRALVLAHKLKNETFKTWVDKELNGYGDDDELPDYRSHNGTAKGLLFGPLNQQIPDQPLAPALMRPEHRHFATSIRLRQPIASYDGRQGDKTAILQWPADIVGLYQSTFIEGWALNRAWLEIPDSVIRGLVDTVRTRILQFVLQIQDELPNDEEEALETLPPAVVDRVVNVTIMGGHNVVGNVHHFQAPTVIAGDIGSLKNALDRLGVTQKEFAKLEATLKADGTYAVGEEGQKAIGDKTSKWIAATAKKMGAAGLKVGGAVAEEVVKGVVKSYLGIP
ncbi:MAG TPA: hypothetical protein VGX71_25455 [Pseudaminobacter sp.]|nr:hypothetical protein [Pseudaminobacter sp.]